MRWRLLSALASNELRVEHHREVLQTHERVNTVLFSIDSGSALLFVRTRIVHQSEVSNSRKSERRHGRRLSTSSKVIRALPLRCVSLVANLSVNVRTRTTTARKPSNSSQPGRVRLPHWRITVPQNAGDLHSENTRCTNYFCIKCPIKPTIWANYSQ